jgi:hypothetical protein
MRLGAGFRTPWGRRGLKIRHLCSARSGEVCPTWNFRGRTRKYAWILGLDPYWGDSAEESAAVWYNSVAPLNLCDSDSLPKYGDDFERDLGFLGFRAWALSFSVILILCLSLACVGFVFREYSN